MRVAFESLSGHNLLGGALASDSIEPFPPWFHATVARHLGVLKSPLVGCGVFAIADGLEQLPVGGRNVQSSAKILETKLKLSHSELTRMRLNIAPPLFTRGPMRTVTVSVTPSAKGVVVV